MEAPFFENEDVKTKILQKEEVTKVPENLYSELHLSILQTLQSVPALKDKMTQTQVYNLLYFKLNINSIC